MGEVEVRILEERVNNICVNMEKIEKHIEKLYSNSNSLQLENAKDNIRIQNLISQHNKILAVFGTIIAGLIIWLLTVGIWK